MIGFRDVEVSTKCAFLIRLFKFRFSSSRILWIRSFPYRLPHAYLATFFDLHASMQTAGVCFLSGARSFSTLLPGGLFRNAQATVLFVSFLGEDPVVTFGRPSSGPKLIPVPWRFYSPFVRQAPPPRSIDFPLFHVFLAERTPLLDFEAYRVDSSYAASAEEKRTFLIRECPLGGL